MDGKGSSNIGGKRAAIPDAHTIEVIMVAVRIAHLPEVDDARILLDGDPKEAKDGDESGNNQSATEFTP